MDAKDWLSVYAALLSTFLGGYSIYKEYKKRKGKMLFHYEKEDVEESENKFAPHHVVSIVNISETTRVLRQIILEQRLNDGTTTYTDAKAEYPIKLSQYDQYKYNFSTETIRDGVTVISLSKDKSLPKNERMKIERRTIEKCRVTVTDTTGKKYQSQWLELKAKVIGE